MTSNKITIASMNCQGLANDKKRRDVFNYLREKSYSIYLLQDTHFTPKLENYIRAEWGYKCFFASYNSNSRGVGVLFNNNFEFNVNEIYKDNTGNYICVSVKTMDKELLIVNLYGPNRDDPGFYIELEQRIQAVGEGNVIIAGDWNCVRDYSFDCHNYRHHNNPKAQDQIDKMMDNLDILFSSSS